MRPFPRNGKQALRHFGTIESDMTPLLDVFCIDSSPSAKLSDQPSVENIMRRHRRLSILVHPDKFIRGTDSERRAASRAMQILSRAKSQVDNEVSFEEVEGRPIDNYSISPDVNYSYEPSDKEKLLDLLLREQQEKLEEEQRQRSAEVFNDRYNSAFENDEHGDGKENDSRNSTPGYTGTSAAQGPDEDEERAARIAANLRRTGHARVEEERAKREEERAKREEERAKREEEENKKQEGGCGRKRERVGDDGAQHEASKESVERNETRTQKLYRERKGRYERRTSQIKRVEQQRASNVRKEHQRQERNNRRLRRGVDGGEENGPNSAVHVARQSHFDDSERVGEDVEDEIQPCHDPDLGGDVSDDSVMNDFGIEVTGSPRDDRQEDGDWSLEAHDEEEDDDGLRPDSSSTGNSACNGPGSSGEDEAFGVEMDVPVVMEEEHDGDDTRPLRRTPRENLAGMSAAEKTRRRQEQKKASRKRSLDRARAALRGDRVAALSWKPSRFIPVALEVGITVKGRWRCEKLIRADTANLGVFQGVRVEQTLERVRMVCRNHRCDATTVFDWQPRHGLWKLNKYTQHQNECLGQSTQRLDHAEGEEFCKPAYTSNQVARSLLDEFAQNPEMTTSEVANLVKTKSLYRRQPPYQHYRAVRRELIRYLSAYRAVDMAALEGYADLLRGKGHAVKIFILSGQEMKGQRLKAARFIHNQENRQKRKHEVIPFKEEDVDVHDIDENGRYYGGFLFVPSVAEHFCLTGRKTCTADAAHCEGVGRRSYGTIFEVIGYDTNNHLFPLAFAHFVGSESLDTWSEVFSACKCIPGFDIEARTIIVDQEKSIDTAYKRHMNHVKMFLDPLHVKKNLGPRLGTGKTAGLGLYEKALYAPGAAEVDAVKSEFSRTQADYLGKFEDSELYRAYSALQDTVITSQGAESGMSAALRNHIRSVEPQKMLEKVFLTQREKFLRRQSAASSTTDPVPPNIQKLLAHLIQRSRAYQGTVKWLDGTAQMEATIRSVTDGTAYKHVILSKEYHTPPTCCSYSQDGSGLPCFHGVAVLCEKYGSFNLHRFIAKRHLTDAWKAQYENVTFGFPAPYEISEVKTAAKRLVAKRKNLQIPRAIPPPRGRPSKNAGKRKVNWYERGPATQRRRTHNCSLCGRADHNAARCPLRQVFQDENTRDGT